MDIYTRGFAPVGSKLEEQTSPHSTMLLTDSVAFAHWGKANGLQVVNTQIEQLIQADGVARVLETLDASGLSRIVCAMAAQSPDRFASYAYIRQSAHAYMALLRGLLKQSRSLTLIGLRRHDALVASLLDGMGLSARQESTGLRYASLIFDAPLGVKLAEALLCMPPDDGVRYRFNGHCLERERLTVMVEEHDTFSDPLHHRGCYVVTGGSGGVGRLLCRWLANHYQAKVCVIGRSRLNERLRDVCLSHGVASYVQADVSDAKSLEAALQHFSNRYGGIDGVFHLAGCTADRLLVNKSEADLESVLAPKIGGALSLLQLDETIPLGFVCHFTSLSGLLGNIGQADYAAANVFVDELSRQLNETSVTRARWMAVNWGLWASSGMQMPEGQSDLLPISEAQGFQALQRILCKGIPCSVALCGKHELLSAWIEKHPVPVSRDADVLAVEALETGTGLEKWLGELVYTFSRMRDVSPKETLIELGVNSSALISIVSAIEKRLSSTGERVSLSKALIFDYPSIAQLAAYLLKAYPQAVLSLFGSGHSVTASRPDETPRFETQTNDGMGGPVIDWLRTVVQRFSGVTELSADDNLIEKGIDSVASINIASEIARFLSQVSPVTLSKTLLFEYSSIRQIAAFLLDRYAAQVTALLSVPRGMQTQPNADATSSAVKLEAVTPRLQLGDEPYRPDDMAIIGVAGEFPGADNLEQLWALLEAGNEAISVVPADRWNWRHDYSADLQREGHSYGRHGGFIRCAKQFDPGFFSITPVEAVRIDPQERRLLEITYHALEDAGYFASPSEDTGVFTAVMFGHYQNLDAPAGAISSSFASIANRISYTFDFQGPSLCVDTMCSGSLTALHLAINSIRNGECGQALVGAVNLMPHPSKLKLLSSGRFLSPSGRCHSFGIEADGYVPGEGAIALMIKPLAKAQAGGDRIHALIRASALNSGGRSSGFTVPSPRAQEKVIRQALAKAAVNAAGIDYVEAHGTGTSLGDPIEIQSLNNAYGQRDGTRRWIGSIKSNIGHLESAAGLAGLCKILLQFQHRMIVPTLNCEIENPWLNLGSTSFALPRDRQPWVAEKPFLAALSSFGAGGSNAHVIVQQYCAPEPLVHDKGPYLLPVSARTAEALSIRIQQLLEWLESRTDASLAGVAYTLGVAREHFRHRACFIAGSLRQFRDQLRSAEQGTRKSISAKLERLREAYLSGETVDFSAFHAVRTLLSLPHYPFEEKEYWDESIGATLAVSAVSVAHSQDELICLQPIWRRSSVAFSGASQGHAGLLFCTAEQAIALGRQAGIVLVTLDKRLELEEHQARVRPDSLNDCREVLRHYANRHPENTQWLISLVDGPSVGDIQSPWTRFQFTLAKAIANSAGRYRMAYVYAEESALPTSLSGALERLFRVLHMEQPSLELVSLMVEEQAFREPGKLIALALDELAKSKEGLVTCRYQGTERWESAFQELSLPTTRFRRFRERGVYLISGGMGLIGQALAEHLLRRFNATLVLIGRSPESSKTRQRLTRLAQVGGAVYYQSVDIRDETAVRVLIEQLLTVHGHLHGVLHCAGMTRDALLRGKTEQDFQDVMAVKINGVRSLDVATAMLPLDFFVLFSSVSGLFGNVGQADYSAANHYLDLFVKERQRQVQQGRRYGLSLSVNWPLWLDEQNEAQPERAALGRYLQDVYGMRVLTPSVGADLLERLIESVEASTTQLAPLLGEAEKIRRSIGTNGLKVAEGGKASRTDSSSEAPVASGGELRQALKEHIGVLSGLPDVEIDEQCSFGDLGLNSVMLQQLAAHIEERFGVAIAPNAFFTYNSLTQLASYLCGRGATLSGQVLPIIEEASLISANNTTVAPSVVLPSAAADDRRIAIIGMDGRLPGGQDLEAFWEGLMANRSAIGPLERWPEKESYAGTIPDVDYFDARFFGLSGREAVLMDPQHRLFLQASYNAFLDAGYIPSRLQQVGVFAGVQFSDYQTLLQRSGLSFHPYAATGNAHAMLANRVSYLFDFEGPSQSIDTACSSALVALNRAVLALQRRECDYALAGAVSLLLDSDMTDAAQSMGVLSPCFRCASFDSEADGYVRGEGVGCLLLKRLADARKDGDSIHAVIEAIAENHGGRANSLTAPNPHAQKRLLLSAYTPELAGKVSYIEAHGTGTKLGDPVEIDALKSAWQALVPGSERPVLLGSVKTNVGHLEPAAAVPSLFKVIMAFKYRMLPANINFNTLNPYIELQGTPFQILARNIPWEGKERVAGISSFGFGGTNAHVVLSAPMELPAREMQATAECLIVLSAKSQRSLLMMVDKLKRYLQSAFARQTSLVDIGWTLGAGREHYDFRLAWMVSSHEALANALRLVNAESIRVVTHVGDGLVESVTQPAGQWSSPSESYLQGYEPDWASLYPNARRVHLPGYVFDTRRYWFEASPDKGSSNAGARYA